MLLSTLGTLVLCHHPEKVSSFFLFTKFFPLLIRWSRPAYELWDGIELSTCDGCNMLLLIRLTNSNVYYTLSISSGKYARILFFKQKNPLQFVYWVYKKNIFQVTYVFITRSTHFRCLYISIMQVNFLREIRDRIFK